MNKPLKLSELTNALDKFFQKNFGGREFWVIGEVSSHKVYSTKGWHFFDLIEKDGNGDRLIAKMPVVAWSEGFRAIAAFEMESGQRFTNGIEVLVKAEVSYNQQYGMKLTLSAIDTSFTLGQMERKRRDTLARLVRDYPNLVTLREDRYHTFNQKQALATIIKRIAVISSEGAAGFEDFIHTLEQNTFGYTFTTHMYFSRVQGIEAAQTLARRVYEVNQANEAYDLVVMIRGGGAQADLFVFDEFVLNREIARSRVPVWVGIGHQRDQTIADLFAHQSLKTPTKVAEAVIEYNMRAEQNVLSFREALIQEGQSVLGSLTSDLHRIMSGVTSKAPRLIYLRRHDLQYTSDNLRLFSSHILSDQRSDLRSNSVQLPAIAERKLNDSQRELLDHQKTLQKNSLLMLTQVKERLSHTERVISIADPENLLKRGYALIEHEGKLITNASSLRSGEELLVRFHREEVKTEVKQVRPRER